MPQRRLALEAITCDRTEAVNGDDVAVIVYQGNAGEPTSWLWKSGEEVMQQNQTWELEGLTSNFQGRAWVAVVELSEDGEISNSYGRFEVDTESSPVTAGGTHLTQMVQARGCYTLRYRIAQAIPDPAPGSDADTDFEPDLSMLRNGSVAPVERRLAEIRAQHTASDPAPFRQNVLQLGALCREAVRRFEKVRLGAHLRDSTESDDEKTARAGLVARDIARIEFLLGWMYKKGYDASESWEVNNANKGPLIEPFLGAHGLSSTSSSGLRIWCTMFSGAPYRWLGFHVVNAASQSLANGVFYSGYRLHRWASQGLNHSTTRVGDTVNTARGGYVYGRKRVTGWFSSSPPTLMTWNNLWDDMQANGKQPQPGDVILIKHYDHTVLVDDVEASGDDFYVYTAEGNIGHASRGYKLDIRGSSTVDAYAVQSRRCLASNASACVTPAAGQPHRTEWRRKYGIALIRPGWDNLAADPANQPPVAVTTEETPGSGAASAGNGAGSTDDDSAPHPQPVAPPAGTSNVIEFGNLAPPGELVSQMLEKIKAFMADATLHDGPWIKHPDEDRVWAWCGKPSQRGTIR